jgi:hypothetical protein
MKNSYKMLLGKLEGRRTIGRRRRRWEIILKGILGKLGLGVWIELIWLSIGTVGGIL